MEVALAAWSLIEVLFSKEVIYHLRFFCVGQLFYLIFSFCGIRPGWMLFEVH